MPDEGRGLHRGDRQGTSLGRRLALAYLHRGLSESGPDGDKRSKADFRTAVRMYNDAIHAQPLNPYLYIQRGVVHQTIGEADRAIIDYSDAIRLAPRETLPLINRGVVLYIRKDNNEGAIADFNGGPQDQQQGNQRLDQSRHRLSQAQGRRRTRRSPTSPTAIKILPDKIEPVSPTTVA